MDAISIIMGLIFAADEAFGRALKALAAEVGGGGVLVAMIMASVALFLADAVEKRVEKLKGKVEELEEKLRNSRRN